MNRVLAAFLACLIGGLAVSNEIERVSLKFQFLKNPELHRFPFGSLYTPLVEFDPRTDPKPPKGFTSVRIGTLPFNQRHVVIMGAKHPTEDRYTKIWIDFNHDGKVQKREVASYKRTWKTDRACRFYEFPHSGKQGKHEVYTDLVEFSSGMIGFRPRAYLHGDVKINGIQASVDVFDHNINGRFGDADSYCPDLVVFKQKTQISGEPHVEMQRVDGSFRLADGLYYSVRLSRERKELIVQRKDLFLGVIEVVGAELNFLDLYGPSGNRSISKETTEGIPEGMYQSRSASLYLNQDDGKRTLCDYDLGWRNQIKIQRGRPFELDLGKPSRLVLYALKQDKSFNFELTYYSSKGYRITNIAYLSPKGETSFDKNPELTIKGPAGNLVFKSPLEFG